MKTSVQVSKDVEIKYVVIDIAPRYIGDSEDDDMPSDFPLLNEEKTQWRAKVNIDTGIIEGWPHGDAREMFVKVCDAGIFSLLDAQGNELAKLDGYVPHGVVPGEYGDYVSLKIDENGRITNWPKSPDVDEFFEGDD